MLELRHTEFNQIQQWFVDFQKKSHCFEMPSDGSTLLGIYIDNVLSGYFILFGYEDGTLEIQQGYLKPLARHRHYSYEAMNLLQKMAKTHNYTTIILKASRSLRSYTKFMTNLGFKTESIIFSKGI